ncbi:glycosyltransferase family 2 protein [Candidatus Saccharibacteria bacterium]|nr:glycosyltransferase family 2 protein [Candidatus Saccharibacteria bacterium]
MKLLIIVFCKNEAETLGKLLAAMPRKIDGVKTIDVFVLDDGSTDGSADIARKTGANVVADGASKGLAFRFRQAVDLVLAEGADVMVTIDGDMQYLPKDIPKIAAPVIEGRADMVAADRFTDPKTGKKYRPANMPLSKYIGNRLGTKVISRLSKQTFRDVTSGFRAYSREALLALNVNSDQTYTQESFQILALKRMRIVSVPIPVIYYKGRRSRVVASIVSYVANSALNIVRAYRDFAPLRFFFWLGFLPVVLGVGGGLFSIWHWMHTGMFSPYKFVGITSLYLFSLGIIIWLAGILADMLARVNRTQEKIYEAIKRELYKKD